MLGVNTIRQLRQTKVQYNSVCDMNSGIFCLVSGCCLFRYGLKLKITRKLKFKHK